ncbi:E3 ubiquitin- ligase Hakai [Brachionus plicatilis]|uniref:E3 ubiquitin-protein ligase Hakai n=1 Tax=Brachionus plicatilis TaxID=10195 RepID=A0A3M7PKX8_BRAPC|nr:E3 ubiquitin- ligase Hakai [Brachionus plicatilis]
MDLSDLDTREERADLRQSVKKHIQLKIKASSNLIFPSNSSNTQPPSSTTSTHIESEDKNFSSINFVSNLNWSYNINKMGQKILSQKMNVCISCGLPILVFGRLLPCKHVVCFDCATKFSPKICLRESCHENVDRIEKVNAGRIFICTYEQDFDQIGNQADDQMKLYEKSRCGRSYMSQRDLDAHINHRHLPNIKME